MSSESALALMQSQSETSSRLSEADNVVLIGHGTGCNSIMELVNHRGTFSLCLMMGQLTLSRRRTQGQGGHSGRRDAFASAD